MATPQNPGENETFSMCLSLGMNLTAFTITLTWFNWYRKKREDKLMFKLSKEQQPTKTVA